MADNESRMEQNIDGISIISGNNDNGNDNNTTPNTGNRQINLQISQEHDQIGSSASSKRNHSSTRINMFNEQNDEQSETITNGEIIVKWENLIYTVHRTQLNLSSIFGRGDGGGNDGGLIIKQKRTILKGISGQFRTGHLTAVMGPSGSGKSTMLECIVGFRKKGMSGNVSLTVNGESNKPKSNNVRIALISQTDYLIDVFTVREMLVYASRLKNHSHKISIDTIDEQQSEPSIAIVGDGQIDGSKNTLIEPKSKSNEYYHNKLADNVLAQLGLEICADTRAANCSGGQKKRISMGLEMISKPNILILDEPTSGLDSSSCFQTVSVMQRLTKNSQYPTAVVCTIHQPSARVFNLFDHIYIISYNGHCIYEGSPKLMLDYLRNVGLHCPQFYNPADFIAECASGENGFEEVQRLIEIKERLDLQMPLSAEADESSNLSLKQYSSKMNFPTTKHIWILFQRNFLQIIRDPTLNWLQFFTHFSTAVFIGILYGSDIGEPALCPPLESPLNDLEKFTDYRAKYQSDLLTATENLSFFFFTLMFTLFSSMMPMIMTFPTNLSILKKEKINGWYSLAAYYISLSIATIPLQIIFPSTFVIISYYMTGQILSFQRFGLFILITILLGFIAQSQGLLIGGLFMTDANVAVFVGPISAIPGMLFGNFFVRISTVPNYLKIFGYISPIRYGFELMIMSIYGMERCKIDPLLLKNLTDNNQKPDWMGMATMILGEDSEKFIESFTKAIGGSFDPSLGKEYASTVLEQFNVDESCFYTHFLILILFIVVLRVATYFIVAFKINQNN